MSLLQADESDGPKELGIAGRDGEALVQELERTSEIPGHRSFVKGQGVQHARIFGCQGGGPLGLGAVRLPKLLRKVCQQRVDDRQVSPCAGKVRIEGDRKME